MTDIDLTTLPRQKAVQVCQEVFGMDNDEANDFLDLARGEVTTKAQKRYPKGNPKGGQFAPKVGAALNTARAYGKAASIGFGQAAAGGAYSQGLRNIFTGRGFRQGFGLAVGASTAYDVLGRAGAAHRAKFDSKTAARLFRTQRAARIVGSSAYLAYRLRKPLGAAFRGARKGLANRKRYNASIRRGAAMGLGAGKIVDVNKYRFNQSDLVQTVEKAIPAQPFVFKEANGDYRWVLLSSNGYRDRDGQIISTKALERDTALWELDGAPTTPLRWWHVALDDEHTKGLELGFTDFRMVQGHVLIESGKFLTKEIGEGVYNARDQLEASVGFRHSKSEPNAEGVFENIHIFETSLLPKGRASNPLTQLLVTP